ncbi:MAG: aromatic amino acid transport family protein [Candidatus Aenigmatarchaeota archaeon]
MKNSKILESIFLIVGTIIGLGMFILPYAFLKSGFYFLIWFIVLIFSFIILHLTYSELIFQIQKKHNLPGLASDLINKKLKIPVWLFDFWGLEFVFLAYLIALSKFISIILPINILLTKLFIAFVVIFFIYFRTNIFSKIETSLTFFEILLPICLSLSVLPYIKLENFKIGFNDPILSYGILIFSFSGYSSLQIVYDLIGKNKKDFLKINLLAFLIIGVTYLFFTFSIVGALKDRITEETLLGLAGVINPYLFLLFLISAILSILTTFFSLAFYLKRGLIEDFGINKFLSWLLVSLPIILFSFLSSENLAKLASTIGSIFIGINLITILLCYLKLKEVKYFKIPKYLVMSLIFLFTIGWIIGLLKIK